MALPEEKHAEIFCAYLNSLSLKDFTTISLALERCWYASQNLGVSSQNACDRDFRKVVSVAMQNVLPSDLEKIEKQLASLSGESSPPSSSPAKRKP